MSYRIFRKSIAAFLLLFFFHNADAQSLAQAKAPLRYEIDAKRMGVDPNSEDALPRSREFKRIDSTYYVGWMFEGIYKYNHAADYLGYKNASIPLERALNLAERDYRKELSTRTSDVMVFINVFKYQLDYTMIAANLMQCYANMEEQEKAFALLRRVAKWNFQRDLYFDVYNFMGWTVHRNRFYTSAKYSFLKNSIEENEALANRYLDSGMRRILRNTPLNSKIWQPGYELPDKLAVYHYKSILHSYAFNIDSAKRYYNLMRSSNIFPHNNYATFRAICGDFREAEYEYKQAVTQDAADKRLKEWAYYTSIIDIYKGLPKTGAELMRGMIKANGSTPGFGWYNIALARCMMYDGQLAEAERYINKAAEFKELHIGTTLGQTHYDFSIQLLKLKKLIDEIEAKKFEHSNWWYNPSVLMDMAKLATQKYMQQFLLINQLAQNPERDRVIYKIFSTESTVSWDEIYYLIHDFSTNFFLKRFEKELQTDERKYIRKYFKYFVARFKMQQGDYEEANNLLNEVLLDPNMDGEYEKLLAARVLEAQAICAKEKDNETAYYDRMYRLYQYYPQLIPYTGLSMAMQLHIAGAEDREFVKKLKSTNIKWDVKGIQQPHAYLVFSGSGDKKRVEYYVVDNNGRAIVERQTLPYKNSASGAAKLAYRLFDIGGGGKRAENNNQPL